MTSVRKLMLPVVLVYLWVMMILLGSIVMETFMVYPNIFHDPPRSLALAMEFLSVSEPGDYFPPLGFISWLAGGGAVILSWRIKPARWWILVSVLMIASEGIASILFFWPRNEILFVEGSALHGADELRRVALEFQTLHWSRLAFNVVAATTVFVGFLDLYRQRILGREGIETVQKSAAPFRTSTAPVGGDAGT